MELGLLYGLINTLGAYEHRLTEQAIVHLLPVTLRFRLERRTLEKGGDLNHRFRLMTRYDFSNIYNYNFLSWNEVFLYLNNSSWTQNSFLDRNRFFLGVRHQFENLAFEWGYMNQYTLLQKSSVSDHLLTLYLFY